MSKLFSLDKRVALVTGASRGLGLAMAKALAEHGATVLINGRDSAALEAAGKDWGGIPAAFDVSDPQASRKAIEDIAHRHGRLDILINNAGIQHRRPLVDWLDDDFDRVISTNLSACFRLSRDAVRIMLPQKFGRIINTGSVAAILARPTVHGYVAAKAGLHGLTRSMAAELAKSGITVNAALLNDQAFKKWVEERTPAGRWARPEELGGAAVFLASDAASYVNGHVLAVDGGLSVSL